jgi:integrase
MAENNGPTTANKTMRLVRALFNYSYATYDICPANPVTYLTHIRGWYKERRRRTYIKPHDLKKWWQAVQALENDTYRDFFLLMLFTGLRRGEAQRLCWDDIDFIDKTFTVTDTKNGDPLTLPLGGFLLNMLEERRKRYGNYEYVFPGAGEHGYLHEPKKGIAKVIKSSGIQFTNHDLRRTFITIAESLEISAYALKRLINHRATDVTGGYIIVDVERLRSPVNKIEAFILEKVNGNEETQLNINTTT